MEFKPKYKIFNLEKVECLDNRHKNFECFLAFGKEKSKWHNLGSVMGVTCSSIDPKLMNERKWIQMRAFDVYSN